MTVPEVTLTHLNRADGSATYTHNGYSLIGAVNGPIEVLRRDEMPEEATIEVNIRPAIGVGSTSHPPSTHNPTNLLCKVPESATSKPSCTTRCVP
jgi:hypothetical protein